MHTFLLLFFITFSIFITGCNEEAGLPTDTTQTTKIAYGSVEGLTYICSSGKVGTTDSNGSYECDGIDNITLYIGDKKLNTVLSEDTLLTPYELFPGDNLAALNYIRLIEALNTNAESNGTIKLDPDKIAMLPETIDFSSTNFENEIEPALLKRLKSLEEAQVALNKAVIEEGGVIPQGSHRPIAQATFSQDGTLVTLDASSSYDEDKDRLSYYWSLITPDGSSALLNDDTALTPQFTVDKTGRYSATLKVKDGVTFSEPYELNITIASDVALPPIAEAGDAQNVLTGSLVTLDATASSAEGGDALSFTWSIISQPSNITLSDINSPKPTFTADVSGNYTFKVTVGNANGSDSDTVVINAATGNVAPVANAGADQNVITPTFVTLDGAGSSDANGDTLTYKWSVVSQPTGSNIVLSDTTAVKPTFSTNTDGTYTFSLTVSDGTATSAPDTVKIVSTTNNVAPVADAGSDQNVITTATVNLDGTNSSDANGDVLTYLWSITAHPATSSATLSSLTSATPSFTADVDGTYTIQLIVNDGTTNSNTDAVTITATTSNAAPIANAGPDGTVDQNVAYPLDGSGSSDANGDTLSYQWSVVSGTGGSFSNATLQSPTFTPTNSGSYVLQLIVNDGSVDSLADNMTLTVVAVQKLKKTGQTFSEYTGDDGYYQNGETASYTIDGETVIDNKTGLTWQNSDPYYVGSKTLTQAQSYCATLTLNGQTDWRLPNVKELLTLVTKARTQPAMDPSFIISYSDYWSSTALSDGDNRVIDFDYGLNQPENPNAYNEVRCVRGQMETDSFQKVGDVVIDNTRKLMWQDNASLAKADYRDALNACENLNLNGATDWRLPNINELLSVVDFNNKSGVFSSIFTYNEYRDAIWSSTRDTSYTSYILGVVNKETTIFFSKKYEEPIITGFDKRDSTFTNRSKYYKCVRNIP